MSHSSRPTPRVALVSLFVLTVATTLPFLLADDKADRATAEQEVKLGLEGYCPVCVVEANEWMKGNPDVQTTFDGVTYQFPQESMRKMFLANAAKYVPALGGDCIVCYAMTGKRVPGNIQHHATHQGRLYLFPSDRERQAFLEAPEKFAQADLALDGNCAVCLKHANKTVPGKPEFTAIHKGLRYQFPSDRERRVFLKDPQHYATAEKAVKAGAPTTSATISVRGKTTCAGCEHGVTPLGAPDELGLAVNTADGQVIVVENAHTRWPSVYKARYEGQNVEVKGRVIKSQGKIKWVEPIELTVL